MRRWCRWAGVQDKELTVGYIRPSVLRKSSIFMSNPQNGLYAGTVLYCTMKTFVNNHVRGIGSSSLLCCVSVVILRFSVMISLCLFYRSISALSVTHASDIFISRGGAVSGRRCSSSPGVWAEGERIPFRMVV